MTRAAAAALAALLLAGCPSCPDGELRIVDGADPVAPGGLVVLELHFDGVIAGPDDCGGYWYVDGVEGGDATVGTIDTCGRYVAPAAARTVLVEAAEHPIDGCADCCPYGRRTITVE